MPIRQPLRVAFDIHRLSPGGFNGGIKIHLYEFMRQLSRYPDDISLLILTPPEIVEELDFVAVNRENELHILNSYIPEKRRDHIPLHPHCRYWPAPPQDLLEHIAADLLYCGFVHSPFYHPDVPQISLIVDLLHKDLPHCLPEGEIADREQKVLEALERSTLIQTNSRFCVQQFEKHYQTPKEKLFPIYLPVHGRFNEVSLGKLPNRLQPQNYFLYPANHWPHKNHETLFEAYHLYTQKVDTPLQLALTGHPNERQSELEAKVSSLGLTDEIIFAEHLSDPDFKALWENAHSLVFPSLYEGFGLPILEGMHFQKPIAASRAASIPEIGQDLIDYFDPNDLTDLANALLRLHKLDTESINYAQRYQPIISTLKIENEAKKLLDKLIEVGK